MLGETPWSPLGPGRREDRTGTQVKKQVFLHVLRDSPGTVKSGNLFTFALKIKQPRIYNKLVSAYSLVSKGFSRWAQFSSLKVREKACINPEKGSVGMEGWEATRRDLGEILTLLLFNCPLGMMPFSFFRPQFPYGCRKKRPDDTPLNFFSLWYDYMPTHPPPLQGI